MRRTFTTSLLVIAILCASTVADAKSVSDPNEASVSEQDIRTATLALPTFKTFAWKMVTWDPFTSLSLFPNGMTLFLDTKGGTGNDAIVVLLWDPNYDRLFCQVERPSGSFIASGVASRPSTKSAVCKFPRSALTIDKRIRWRTISESMGGTDKAPDTGYIKGV